MGFHPFFFSNSLFHVVVQNDDISTQIIRHLNSLKGGRVTFIPLNRVKAPHVTYPKSSDVVPLLKRLKFSPNYTPAFAQVYLLLRYPCFDFFSLLDRTWEKLGLSSFCLNEFICSSVC